MLVEEAIAGDTPRLGCPCNKQNKRLLAGVAQPARVTVSENSLGSPCVGGTLSPSRITDLEVTNAPELSSGGPPSVPSRISVVLVEQAKAGGTPRRECPRDDQDIRSLAGVAKPASVTVYDDSLGSPCVGGTLSSSDIAGRLLPVGPVGIPFPVGPVNPAGPVGPYIAGGPLFSDPAACAGGPVGPYETLSSFDSDPAGPAGFAGGPVGPCGTLSPFKYDPAGPDGLYVSDGPVGPLSPSNTGGFFPLSDPTPGGTLPPGVEGLPSCPDGVGTHAGVVMICGNAYSIENDPFAEEYGHTEILAIDGFWGEIVDGMVVYYDDYNFDMTDGMDLMVYERGGGPFRSEMTVDVETRPQVDNDPDDPDLVDIRRDVQNLPNAFPAIFDKMAAVPMTLPVDV